MQVYDAVSAVFRNLLGDVEGRAVVQNIDHSEANPRYMVTPELSGTPKPIIIIDGATTVSPTLVPDHIRVTINPGDDVMGATRLLNGYPDTLILKPDDYLEISSDSAITDLYLVAVDMSAADEDTYGAGYIVTGADTDLADWLAEMCHLTFDGADDVRKVRLTTSAVRDTNYMDLKVEGLSYA